MHETGENGTKPKNTTHEKTSVFRGSADVFASVPNAGLGPTGLEPVTSSVSGKRASHLRQSPEVETGFEPVYTALQAVASPLGHSTKALRQSRSTVRDSERTTGFEPATLTLAR